MEKLNKENIEDILALTPLQEGMLFHYLKEPEGNYYFEQLSLEISAKIEKEIFERAWNFVIETNEMLRAVFRWEKVENPVQIILKEHPLQPRYCDLPGKAPGDTQNQLEEIRGKDREQKFDLREVPFRVTLCNTGQNKYEMIISNHHILYDGWSTGIILKEFFRAYNTFSGGEKLEMPIKTKFREFLKCIKNRDETGETYWKNYLKDFDTRTPLPIKEKDINAKTTGGIRRQRYRFPREVTAGVEAFVKKREITLASLLYSAWGVLLQRYGDCHDVVFGTTVAGRNAAVKDVENIVGLFIDTLPLRVRREPRATASELLKQVHDSLQAREQFENTPLPEIKKNSKLEGNEEIFDTILVIENYPLDRALAETSTEREPAISIDSYSMFYMTNYDLTVAIGTFNEIDITCTYRENLFSDISIRRLMGHLEVIIKEITASPGKKVGEIEILTPGEKEKLSKEFNRSAREYSLDKAIHRLFEEQVEITPDSIAAIGTDPGAGAGEMALTYRELNEASNRLARLLQENGVAAETVVGIMMEPSLEMIAGLLAILKAGGAYLPIDTHWPQERIRFMLEDSGASLLLTRTRAIEGLSFTALRNFEKNRHLSLTVTPPRAYIKDFDNLPYPDRSLINLGNYKNKIGMASVTDAISIQTTRGCPYECLYCHKIWSKKHVLRSAEKIFDEIRYYYQKGVTNFACIDDCFNLSMENSSRLFRQVIQNKLKLQLFFPNGLRGDIMSADYIDLMAEAGTRGINLSLETASPRLQKLLKKNLDLDKFKKVVDYIAGQHPEIILEMATMHGFPTETEEEAMMTLDFIKSIRWLHFPYIHILKIFPNTEMEAFALEHGISKEDIMISKDRAFHELPETLPYPKSFTRKYQAGFMNEYFLNKERLKHVLPAQIRVLSEDALAQKYNAYLPVKIEKLRDIIDFTGLDDIRESIEARAAECGGGKNGSIRTNIFDREPLVRESKPGAMRILLLDLSQHFSTHHMLYKVAEQPLGLIYLMTYLQEKFGEAVDGRIYKSGNDFDSYTQLKKLVRDYKPHLVGIRTLTFFKEFFHETVSLLRQWGIDEPVITGGPYASSDYDTILKDRDVDLVVFGEGEETFAELVREMLGNGFRLPGAHVLKGINGIAFVRPDSQETPGPYHHSSFITHRSTSRPLAAGGMNAVNVVPVDLLAEEIAGKSPRNLTPTAGGNNLVYVMYTSGSTGVPKGVMVEHRNVNNCIQWMQDKFHLRKTGTIVQRTDMTFDPSVWEIFWPLAVGAKVKLVPAAQRKDAHYLVQLMEQAAEKGMSMMYCPASMVKAMAWVLGTRADKPRLNMPRLIIGAEPIKAEVVDNFYEYYGGKIVNTYGPTEGTINNTWYDLEPGERCSPVPIGKPVANNQVYILSKDMQLMPINTAGEICIAGDSVARGYIRNREKTDARFIPNPFGPGKLYRTGDIGQWSEEGNIRIKGRVDEQVKIRGYRIEPGEIEKALLSHGAAEDCVVVVRDSKEDEEEEKTCNACGITSRYPGAVIDDNGQCKICVNYRSYKGTIDAYFKTPADLEKLLREKNRDKTGPYDCMLLYAGGRGAAYALYRLKEMGINVLAATYDNGYFSPADLRNIKRITAGLGVEHVVLEHKSSARILRESLKSAHTVCRGCFLTSTTLAEAYANRNNIRVVVGATLSRGQIIENKLFLFLEQGIHDPGELEKEVIELKKSAPAMDRNIFEIIDIHEIKDGQEQQEVTTVDFYRYFDIANREMMEYLNKKDPYWKTRKNYSLYSTNCAIKQIGDYAYLRERGYHFYGSSTAWEKRLGHLSLEELKEDLKCRMTGAGYEKFRKRIDYRPGVTVEKERKYLCAYIVSREEILPPQWREYLTGRLPEYMIPSYFIPVKAIPLTTVGKLDRKALPPPDRVRIRLESKYVPPKSEIEKSIVRVWQEVLKVEKVGVDDNFFDLGGNSLDIIQVSGKLKETLSREVPVVAIFTYPTIALLAQNLSQAEAGAAVPVSPRGTARYDEREKGKERLRHRLGKKTGG